jgi:hypothetical protein
MDVLEDEREVALAEVAVARFADGAADGIEPEGFVIGAAVVVAGEAEKAWNPEDEEGG